MKRVMALPAIAATLLLTGCLSFGTNVSDEQIDQFQKGKTTEAEVIAKLGQPNGVQRDAHGQKVDTYSFTSTSPSAKMMIPFIGPWLAGPNTGVRTVSFTFNSRGILEDWSSTGAQMNSN